MPVFYWNTQEKEYTLHFEGTPTVAELLREKGLPFSAPCGGKGTCGKCAIAINGNISAPDAREKALKTRLACRTVLLGDAWGSPLTEELSFASIESTDYLPSRGGSVPFAAVDLGTTTIVVKAFRADGTLIGEASALNPQRGYAADVIGRIRAALQGKSEELKDAVTHSIAHLLEKACQGEEIPSMVVTGNTAMLYLLTGRSPVSIAAAPFVSETLFGETTSLLGRKVYLPPCMNAFVGADTVCALLASGMCEKDETALLCDVGTNGEIALWKDGKLYVTSAAAGPAFEGGEISRGCGYIPGAVDRVWVANGKIFAHTVEDEPAVGICGSGLLDAVACFLEMEEIDETGAMDGEFLPLAGDVGLTQQDIRALQLAKAAIRAGIECLLSRAGITAEEVATVYLAGGFGTHLSPESAAAIGMLPRCLKSKTVPLGNAALQGACMLASTPALREKCRSLAANAIHVSLGGREDFNKAFLSYISF